MTTDAPKRSLYPGHSRSRHGDNVTDVSQLIAPLTAHKALCWVTHYHPDSA